MKEFFGSVVRHGASAIGGGVAVGGACAVDTTEQAIGAAFALLAFGASIWRSRKPA